MIKEILSKNGLNYNKLKNNLIIKYIRGSGKGGQKRNKTSSTCQLIDNFDYTNYIPKENIKKYNGKIVFTIDIGRKKLGNYNKAIQNWENKLLSLFKKQKERSIDPEIEKERKKKIKEKEILLKNLKKYKNKNII